MKWGRGKLLVALALASIGCGDMQNEEHAANVPPAVVMPDEIRASYIASIQRTAAEDFAGLMVNGRPHFPNAIQRFDAIVDSEKVELTLHRARGAISLQTSSVGCEGAMKPVLSGTVELNKNEAFIQRDQVREWYLNGPLGIEQGFILEKAPNCSGLKKISLAIESNLQARLDDPDRDGQGSAVRFFDHAQHVVAVYGDLYVKDATNRRLPAWMTLNDRRLELHVDDSDAVYPVEVDPLLAIESQKIWATDGKPNDNFGNAVAIHGDTAVVGPYEHSVGPNVNQGAAYVFVRTAGTWTFQTKLTANDGAANDYFGQAVAIDGDTIVIGAYTANGATTNAGAAYVFVRNGNAWVQQAKLTAGNDGAAYDHFGWSVGVSEDLIVVGANADDVDGKTNQGSAHLFERNSVTKVWTEIAKLVASDGAAEDSFGYSVAIASGIVVIGARQDDVDGPNLNEGSAYVFEPPAGGWASVTNETGKLVVSDATGNEFFGHSMAISGSTVIVGENVTFPSMSESAAYIFERPLSGWKPMQTESAKLVPSDPSGSNWFGYSVGISDYTVIIGAPHAGIGADLFKGAAYVYGMPNFGWSDTMTESTKIVADDSLSGDELGFSVGLWGNTAVVGAHYAPVGGNTAQGAAYVYRVALGNGDECFENDECLYDFCDQNEYVCACTQDSHCSAGQTCNLSAVPNECTSCGNNVLDSGEICDDGNWVNGDGCDNNCTVSACGNAVAESNEACDDGNVIDGDGCSGACSIETGWLCGCPVAFETAQEAGKLGDSAQTQGTLLYCAENEVFMGLHFDWTQNVGGMSVPGSATRLIAICGRMGADNTGLIMTKVSRFVYSGGLGCNGWDPSTPSDDVLCPPGQTIVGLKGTNAPMNTAYFTSAALICQAVDLNLVPFGPTTVVPIANPVGEFPGTPVEFTCPSGQIAQSFVSYEDCGLEALSLRCAKPKFDCSFEKPECTAICGDGLILEFEQCDDMNLVNGDCCSKICQFESPNMICRSAAHTCDAPESCSGNSATCPADENVADGTTCDDGNGCTVGDTCQSGACNSGNPAICMAESQCHEVGTCNSSDGICSSPVKADGSSCDDGNPCTVTDRCTQGVCAGESEVICSSEGECLEAGFCDSATGKCVQVPKANGTPCAANGICRNGECVATCETVEDCGPNEGEFECFENRCVRIAGSSCDCQIPESTNASNVASGLGMIAGLALLGRRRRTARARK